MGIKVRVKAKLALMVALCGYASGCGVVEGALRKPSSGEDAKNEGEARGKDANTTSSNSDLVMYPPKEYFHLLLGEAFDSVDRDQIVSRFVMPQSVWLNFDGGTVPYGFKKGQSFLVCSTAAVIPPLGISEADKNAIVQKIQEAFSTIGVPVNVSSSRPGSGDPTTVFVGGSPLDLGCPDAKGRHGLAPLDSLNANRSDTAFVFSSAATSTNNLASTILHVLGHTFGLDHVVNDKDIMHVDNAVSGAGFSVSPLAGGAAIQDGPSILRQVLGPPFINGSGSSVNSAPLPTYFPGLGYVTGGVSTVPGMVQLNAIGQLTNGLGDSQILDLSSVNSRLRSTFGHSLGQTNLAGIERTVTVLALLTRAASSNQGGMTNVPLANEAVPASDEEYNESESFSGKEIPSVPSNKSGLFIDGSLVSQYLLAQQGSGPLSLERVASSGGYQNVDSAVKSIQFGLINGNLKFPSEGQFSDLTTLFNLPNGVGGYPSLISSFWLSAYVVKAGFSGLNLSGLTSLLKVTYSQQFENMSKNSR